MGTLALWGLDSKHQRHEHKDGFFKAKDLALLALPPASCMTLDVSLSSLDLSLAFCKVRGLLGSVKGPSCSQGTKGLAVDSHLGKLQSGPHWGRVRGLEQSVPLFVPSPCIQLTQQGLLRNAKSTLHPGLTEFEPLGCAFKEISIFKPYSHPAGWSCCTQNFEHLACTRVLLSPLPLGC